MAAILLCLWNLPAQNELRRAEEERTVKFQEKVHDFGDVPQSVGSLTHTFRFKNVSDKPFVVHNVISSCGCTTPQWTKQPIRPSEEGEIKVTFTNDQGPYPFDKTLTVYISGLNRPVILRIRGNVIDRNKPLSEIYPDKFGPLGMRQKDFSLGYLEQGIVRADYSKVANLSRKPVTVTVTTSSPCLKVTVTPAIIPAGQTARLDYSINPSAGKSRMWGRQDFKASFVVDGRKAAGEFTVSGVIKDNFSGMTDADIAMASVPVVNKSYFEFGEIPAGKQIDAEYTVANKGKSALKIYAIDKKEEGVTIVTPTPVTVKSGASVKIKVKFDSSRHEGEMLEVLSLVTNSPTKPIVNLFLTGNVIK